MLIGRKTHPSAVGRYQLGQDVGQGAESHRLERGVDNVGRHCCGGEGAGMPVRGGSRLRQTGGNRRQRDDDSHDAAPVARGVGKNEPGEDTGKEARPGKTWKACQGLLNWQAGATASRGPWAQGSCPMQQAEDSHARLALLCSCIHSCRNDPEMPGGERAMETEKLRQNTILAALGHTRDTV